MVCKTMYGGSNPPGTSKHRVSCAFFVYTNLRTMADNYLEKKMELHKARVTSPVATKAKNNLLSLLDKCTSTTTFDAYKVRGDQLLRIASAGAKVPVCNAFRYKFITGDDALRLCAFDTACPKAGAYILVCSSALADSSLYISLGRVVQAMQLQAAEIGLMAMLFDRFDATELAREFSVAASPLALLAVGRSAELSFAFGSVFNELSVNDLLI